MNNYRISTSLQMVGCLQDRLTWGRTRQPASLPAHPPHPFPVPQGHCPSPLYGAQKMGVSLSGDGGDDGGGGGAAAAAVSRDTRGADAGSGAGGNPPFSTAGVENGGGGSGSGDGSLIAEGASGNAVR